VITEQAKHVAIPRRFSVTMHEIWLLQPRFELRQRKRVFRLMTHPRFRAAYDFLLLRASESPEIAELGQWWTQAQTVSPEELAQQLNARPAPTTATSLPELDHDDEQALESDTEPAKKRPRRRRRSSGAIASAPVQKE
jgi:poly(A) polymerase